MWLSSCFSSSARERSRSLTRGPKDDDEIVAKRWSFAEPASPICGLDDDSDSSGWAFYQREAALHAAAIAALKRDNERAVARANAKCMALTRELAALKRIDARSEPPLRGASSSRKTTTRRATKQPTKVICKSVVRRLPKAVVVGTSVIAGRRAVTTSDDVAVDDDNDDDALSHEETLLVVRHSVDLHHAFRIMDSLDEDSDDDAISNDGLLLREALT